MHIALHGHANAQMHVCFGKHWQKIIRKTHLELAKGESLSGTYTHVVSLGGAVHDGAEGLGRARGHAGGLSFACKTSSLLARGLVEPCLDTSLPLLLEVLVGDDVVVLHHGACLSRTRILWYCNGSIQ